MEQIVPNPEDNLIKDLKIVSINVDSILSTDEITLSYL